MSDENAVTNAAPTTVAKEITINGSKLDFAVVTLTKGKGKGRTVLVPAERYSSNLEDLITLIRALPKSVPFIYKHTFRGAALTASDGTVKSADDIDAHSYLEELEAEWNVSRATNPIKQLEEELAEFQKENEELEVQLKNMEEMQALIAANAAGDPAAVALYNRLINYTASYRAKLAKISKLKKEAKDKKAKKAAKA